MKKRWCVSQLTQDGGQISGYPNLVHFLNFFLFWIRKFILGIEYKSYFSKAMEILTNKQFGGLFLKNYEFSRRERNTVVYRHTNWSY